MTPRPIPDITSAPFVRGLLSRRTLLSTVGAAGVASVIASCGTKGTATKVNPSEQAADEDRSDTDKTVIWSNWPEYIDVDDKTQAHPTLDKFKQQTGITPTYTEDYNDNDEFFAKVKPQLQANQDTGRDVWCSTDWMVARFIRLNWVQKLDHANMPNVDANLQDSLKNVPFDKGRVYSVPWQSGFTGIAYNPKATGGKKIESVDQLLSDPALKGKVTLLTEMRDTVGLVMLSLGKDPENFTDADFDAAITVMKDAKDRGQLRGFTGNDYGKPLAAGDIAACFAWTGDVVQLQADNPALAYVLPQTGHMLWSDNFVIPNKAQHKKNAEKLINFYYQPEIMAEVEDYVNYISPVVGADKVLEKTDPAVAKNPLIFPNAEVLGRSHGFMALTEEQETKYNQAFQSLIGA
jgi:spermidine/putrescine transport system substrate-binding protein